MTQQEDRMEFYRFVAHDRTTVSSDDFGIHVSRPEMRLELEVYNMVKETPKGYWIARAPEMFVSMELERWVPKTSKKRYAYPTKGEALTNFIKRTEKRISILEAQAHRSRIALGLANNMTKHV